MKRFLDLFKRAPKTSASEAKGRLQFIISQERTLRKGPEYLPQLQQDLINVIAKYVELDKDSINVDVNQKDEFLELNITLPELPEESRA